MATLAGHTDAKADAEDARRRLATAVEELDPAIHTRAHALAATRLAVLQLTAGDLDSGACTARAALQSATWVSSARLMHSLAMLRTIANHHPDQPTMQVLVSEIDTAIGTDNTAGSGTSDEARNS
jgi:hypothetical protein